MVQDSPACRVHKIDDGLYYFKEADLVNLYLLVGRERAMLIDTGYGFVDYRPLIRQITCLPLLVVNTHGDPDHVLGSYLFEEVYLAPEDLHNLAAIDTPAFRREAVKYKVLPEMRPLVDEEAYCAASLNGTRILPLREGDVFDLGGGQTIAVYSVPGHSAGSMAFLDQKNRRFFTGDIITYQNIWNFGAPDRSSLCTMLRTYRKAKALQPLYDEVYSGHAQTPVPPTVVDELIACIQEIRTDHAHDERFESKFADLMSPLPKFSHRCGHVHIIYSEASLRELLASPEEA